MHKEVRGKFIEFSVPKEGRVDCLYLDIKGFVTTGVGNLVENLSTHEAAPIVFSLAWKRRADNQPASLAQIEAEWRHVKSRQDLKGSSLRARKAITALYLDDDAIDALVYRKLEEHDRDFARQFPEWETYPWQAQLAVHSMGWAMGSGFRHPAFRAAVKRRDWITAAAECKIGGEADNPGLIPRNEANRRLLIEAAGQQAGAGPADVARPAPSPPTSQRGGLDGVIAALLRLFGRKA